MFEEPMLGSEHGIFWAEGGIVGGPWMR